MIIKDLWYAIKVCRKYGIKFRTHFHDKTHAYATFNDYTGLKKITISLANPNFMQDFLHELGHLLSYTRKVRKDIDINDYLSFAENQMVEETQAWLFSKRVMGARFSKEWALSCLHSYSRFHYFRKVKPYQVVEYTDKLVKCFNRIEE